MQRPAQRPRSPNHPALRDIDPATRFLYTPKTISVLLVGGYDRLCPIAYVKLVHIGNGSCAVAAYPTTRNIRNLLTAGVCTLVYLSGAFNPSPRPDDQNEAAKFGSYNKKAGLVAAAATYLCKLAVFPLLP